MLDHFARELIRYSSLIVLLPLLIILYRRQWLDLPFKAITCFIVLANVVQGLASLMNAYHLNNLWLLHYYTVLEFSFIVWFYGIILQGFVPSKAIWAIGVGFGILSLLNSIYLQPLSEFNTYARSLEGILVILLALAWYFRTLTEMKVKRLQDEPLFWVNSGFLLYFSGSVLLFAVSNYLLSLNHSLNLYIWAFHGIFSVLLYLFVSIGVWKLAKD